MSDKLTKNELAWFNQRYGTVETQGEFRIIRVEDGVLYTRQSFINSLEYRTHIFEGHDTQLAPLWLADPLQRRYQHGIEFDPSKPPTIEYVRGNQPTRFNLWRGFPVQPQPGNVEPFLDLVRNVVCSGNTKHYEWLMAWMADAVQNPGHRPGTAIVIRGEQGVGKTFFVSCFGAVFGSHFIEISDPNLLVGNFNSLLKAKLLIFADEGAFTDKRASRMLKAMITSDTLQLHEKYQPPYAVKNCARFIFAGNDDRLIHADGDERRYFVLDVSPIHKQDRAYFANLVKWRDTGGLPALLAFLQSYQHSVNLRDVPRTSALMDHKISSLGLFDRWWLDKLQDGRIVSGSAWTEWVSANDVQDDYLNSTGQFTDRSSLTQFGMALKKRAPGIQKSRKSAGYGYRLPPLADCRRAFEERLGSAIEWAEEPPALAVVGGRAAE